MKGAGGKQENGLGETSSSAEHVRHILALEVTSFHERGAQGWILSDSSSPSLLLEMVSGISHAYKFVCISSSRLSWENRNHVRYFKQEGI